MKQVGRTRVKNQFATLADMAQTLSSLAFRAAPCQVNHCYYRVTLCILTVKRIRVIHLSLVYHAYRNITGINLTSVIVLMFADHHTYPFSNHVSIGMSIDIP